MSYIPGCTKKLRVKKSHVKVIPLASRYPTDLRIFPRNRTTAFTSMQRCVQSVKINFKKVIFQVKERLSLGRPTNLNFPDPSEAYL